MLYCWEMRHSRLNGMNAGENICLFFVFSYATLTLGRRPLNAVRHCIFRKSAAALIDFGLKRCQVYSGVASAPHALSKNTNSICRFYYICELCLTFAASTKVENKW